MYMAAVNKQTICGIQHCVLKVIMAGIVCFANWKYLVQTKLQNPFRKLGSCVHKYIHESFEYNYSYMIFKGFVNIHENKNMLILQFSLKPQINYS